MIGQGLTEGLGALVEGMIQKRALQGRQAKTATALQELGLSPEIAALPEGLQKIIIQQKSQEKSRNALQALLGGAPSGTEEVTAEEVSPTTGPMRPGGIESLSDEQIQQIAVLDPVLGRTIQAQKEARGRENLAERKEAQRTKEVAFSQTKEVRKEISQGARGARDNMKRLGRMSTLLDQGKLVNPVFNEALKKLNLDIPALKNPDSQEFDKLTVDFLRGAREIFGARVTNFEAENFLKSIPSLAQSDEGKRRIIRNLDLLNQGALLREKAMRDIVRENEGNPPLDLDDRVEERIDPEIERISAVFLSGDRSDNAPKGVEISAEEVIMIDPAGNRRKLKKSDAVAARKAGYRLG